MKDLDEHISVVSFDITQLSKLLLLRNAISDIEPLLNSMKALVSLYGGSLSRGLHGMTEECWISAQEELLLAIKNASNYYFDADLCTHCNVSDGGKHAPNCCALIGVSQPRCSSPVCRPPKPNNPK